MSWRGVGLVTGWQLTASLCFYTIFAATAFVRSTFGVSRALTGLAVTAVMLGYTLLLFGTGAATDAFGERPLMVGGLLALGFGMVCVATAPSFPLLLAALVFVGLAYASAMPATNRATVVVAPPGRQALAMNVKMVGVTVGSALAALLVTRAAASELGFEVGPLSLRAVGLSGWELGPLSAAGWQVGFLVAAVLAVLVAAATAWRYEGRPGDGDLTFPDVLGLADDPAYKGLVVSGFFLGAAVFTTTAYVVLHVTESVGAAAGVAGAVLAAVQLTGSAGRLLGGELADRVDGPPERGPALVLTAQAALAAVGFLAVALADSLLTAALAFPFLGLFILGFPGLYYATLTALVDDDEVGAATAGGQMSINLGGLFAPPLFGFVADTAGYDVGWTLAAVVAGVAAVVVWTMVASG
jgi:ACS family hexuronate transporter-like MFS transporter